MKVLIITLSLLYTSVATAQSIRSSQIDSVVQNTMKTFDVPGIAVAVVKDGKIIHAKGYGVRSLNTNQKVDEHTLFGIASNSKAFTTAALAILVDEGKITWDDKVIDYIPEFRLNNPYTTAEFTIKDLLTHRSGLGLGAGDLMIFPDSSDFTINDIIHNLRYLKSVSGFRTKYDYDNLLYIVAGEVIKRVSGKSWEEFIETRIMQPLGMEESAAAYERLKNKSNVIDAHAPVNGKVQVIRRDFSATSNSAGGIYSNITDMGKWAILQMDGGKYGEGKQLFSQEQHEEMWSPQTIITVRGTSSYNTHFASYGLGWFLSDVKGYKQASHTGGLAGIVTQVTLIPELKLGIIVLTNQQSGAAFTAITNTIKDSYFGMKNIDRVKLLHDQMSAFVSGADKTTKLIYADIAANKKANANDSKDSIILGVYKDNWLGEVVISKKNGTIRFDSKRSPRLTGEIFAYKGTTYVVKWDDRSMDADAFAIFQLNSDGKASGFTMKPISSTTDFSYDFQDLDFVRK